MSSSMAALVTSKHATTLTGAQITANIVVRRRYTSGNIGWQRRQEPPIAEIAHGSRPATVAAEYGG